MVSLQEGKRLPHDGAGVTGSPGGNEQVEVDERKEGPWKSHLLGRDIYGTKHSLYSLSVGLMKEQISSQ